MKNPDHPRAINSPDNVYQMDRGALKVLQTFGSSEWPSAIESWIEGNKTLREKYAAERAMQRIPARLPNGTEVMLTPEGQNILVKHIIEDFCSLYTPGGGSPLCRRYRGQVCGL